MWRFGEVADDAPGDARDGPLAQAELRQREQALRRVLDGFDRDSRNLVLLNDVVTTTNAEFLAILPRYVPNSIIKLRAYLETGVFRHDVPGLIPPP